ncbi:serine/threonine protein kinase [Archangium violaceum]|uniref:serine/threonine protein kinase n=1 Tax=Archangium violaceum TaxID=83451 RepID=UPI0019514B33|nr:serine/threonine-protein kinase [Archangium violaceum]QRN98630.1 serine/threonine protein kinase [Archangium violaceum]
MNGKSSSSASTVSSGEDVLPVGEAFPRWVSAGMCVGPWRISRWLGQGGYGVVYLSEDTRPESAGGLLEPVALKLAVGRTPYEDPQARQRLLREAEILRRVVHPGVVRCFGQGEYQGVPYLVLEFVPGPNLYEWSAQRNRTAREVVDRVCSLTLALEAVHGAGVFHRDLKGENILVRERDDQPVLLDFGVGDHEGAATLTGAGLPPGTAHYRSPEAVRFLLAEQGQARYCFTLADELYALGVILYRLLTDEYPFSPALPRPLLYERIEQTQPSAPVLLNPRVPGSVSDLVMRLLSKQPEERGGSARAVYTALQAALADGDDRWDEWLFQWDEGPSTHSRSTEKAGIRGPIAPGHEAELMHAAARARELRWQWRKSRALRKRPPIPTPTEPAPAASSRPERKRPGKKAAWVMLAVVCLSGLVWSIRESGASCTDSWRSPMKEGPPVNTQKARSDLPRQEAEDSSSVKEGAHPLERCAAALAAGLVLSACAGVPAQPPRRECPKEALASMERLRVPLDNPMQVHVDVNQPGEYSDVSNFREGPLVSETAMSLEGFSGYLPLGTLLYGYLWTRGKYIVAHYDRAKLPTGEIVPVCFAFGTGDGPQGWPRLWEPSPPGTLNMPKKFVVVAVDHFE